MLDLATFFTDMRTIVLFILIGLDFLSGVASALIRRVFTWERLGDWLLKDVMYILGYLIWYLFTQSALGGSLGGVPLDELLGTTGGATAAAALIASIGNNFREARGKAES